MLVHSPAGGAAEPPQLSVCRPLETRDISPTKMREAAPHSAHIGLEQMTSQKANIGWRKERLKEVWGFLFGVAQLIVMLTVPHLIALTVGSEGVTYHIGQTYILMPSIVSSFGDANYIVIEKVTGDGFASYFSYFRMALYYCCLGFFIINIALVLFCGFFSEFSREVYIKSGRTALLISIIIGPMVFAGSLFIGFLSPDSLGVAHSIAAGGPGVDSLWWLSWPTKIAFGQLFAPLSLAGVRLIFGSFGEK